MSIVGPALVSNSYCPALAAIVAIVPGVPRDTALATREVWGVTCNARCLQCLWQRLYEVYARHKPWHVTHAVAHV
jgi:hypothetical protein